MNRTVWVLFLVVVTGCASSVPRQPAAPAPTPAVGAAQPTPTPTPRPTPVPVVPSVAPVAEVEADAAIRVLLRRTAKPIALPQPGRAYRAEVGGEATWLWGPLEITTDRGTAWQVGAFSTDAAAAAAVRELAARFGDEVRVWGEDPGDGLTRVRLRWLHAEPAHAGAQLISAGFGDAFRVPSETTITVTGAAGSKAAGAEIVLAPAGDWPTAVGDRLYRGRFRVRSGSGGMLLINELAMEDYLRGVVPVEMGPYVFPELEALKAQAVAARTYAVAHLGDHQDEGWDLCATPACQAYHGAGAEHPLTDRAVAETAGLMAVFDGAPIDAMYTSTCGGHTEDAAALFDGRGAPYLRGVRCAWERPMQLAGTAETRSFADLAGLRRWLAGRALGLDEDRFDPLDLISAVASLCGGAVGTPPRELDLDAFAESLLVAGGFDAGSPLVRGVGIDRLLLIADLFDVPLTAPSAAWRQVGWQLEAAAAVLEIREVITIDRGEAVPHPEGVAIYPRRADRSEPLPLPLPLVEEGSGGFAGIASAKVLPGTTLERYRLGDEVLAVVIVRSQGDGEADRRSSWRSWRRERSWSELETRLGGGGLKNLEIVRRGRSGRVVALAVVDAAGNRRLIEGFDVRRALDLPETLFEMHVRTEADGGRTVQFLGRGWGHGVGLCQNGAYGLARSGMDFEAILKHYYTGVDVVSWR